MYAYVDRDDRHHAACVRLLDEHRGSLVVPEPCFVEVAKLLGRRLGPRVESLFLEELTGPKYLVESILPIDRVRAAALVRAYADIGLGSVDALLVAMAERLRYTTIATIDRRHFEIVRPRHVDRFRLVP